VIYGVFLMLSDVAKFTGQTRYRYCLHVDVRSKFPPYSYCMFMYDYPD